jgi:hypothetical protein
MMQMKNALSIKLVILTILGWALVVFLALVIAIFLHEDGHGIGAKLDGIHISTGFNRIGNPGRAPDDPDFRTGLTGGVWTGLLGPVTSWGLAIIFTLWLTRRTQLDRGTWVIAAFAIANGLARAVPNATMLISALRGQLVLEDEVHWGLWYIGKIARPDLGLQGALDLAQTQPNLVLAFPAIWIAVLISLGISLLCLFLAYRHLLHLWRGRFKHAIARGLLAVIPLGVWSILWLPLNYLDQVVRINW